MSTWVNGVKPIEQNLMECSCDTKFGQADAGCNQLASSVQTQKIVKDLLSCTSTISLLFMQNKMWLLHQQKCGLGELQRNTKCEMSNSAATRKICMAFISC